MGFLLSVSAAPFVIIFIFWILYKLEGNSITRIFTGSYGFLAWITIGFLAIAIIILFMTANLKPDCSLYPAYCEPTVTGN